MFDYIRKLFSKHNGEIRHIRDAGDLKGKRVLLRCDFNVPLGTDKKVDPNEAWRIEKALPTITYLKEQGARIILVSHIGRDANESLRPVAEFFNQKLGITIGFIPEATGERASEASERLGNGQMILLENIRSDKREEKNKKSLAKELACLADVFVNEAFSASHRKHASIVSVSKFLPSYVGFQFFEELSHLNKVREAEHPLVVIIGGAKFETKVPLIQAFLSKADTLLIGGALAHGFYKAQGFEIGKSIFEDIPNIQDFLTHSSVCLPEDVVVINDGVSKVVDSTQVSNQDTIVDIGPRSLDHLVEKIKHAKTVIWNGPLGWYEGGFEEGTHKLLDAIAASSAMSIIGGGDTVFVIRKYQLEQHFTFVSTAGGAMLDYLVDETLPGIEAMRASRPI